MPEFISNNWFIFLVILVLAVFYSWYVSIITKRNAMQEAFSGIDVQLKKRTDLIPNILAIANKFMQHEKSLLEEITQLRTQVLSAAKRTENSESRFKLEGQLEQSLSGLMIAVENYPDLKSDQNMLEAQRAYADVEEHISAARRSFNSANRILRNSIQVFPGNIIAGMINVSAMPFFEITESARQPIDAASLLK